ncbi:hypothetical protein GCM10011401_09500 [Nesterenkonia cremea]|uniref:Uncharacterized protein n=1 Tax=Nesterenkonia cremea TaxID=1882340 RepID=A0A917ARD4_9MICC|nr:hypothetical protein GCM10011401_09500 [Nesterenkonia cremea]
MADLGLIVMVVDLQAEADFLELGARLILPRLAGLHRSLVLPLAEVHQLADRRFRIRGYLDQVEISLRGEPQSIFDSDDADLFPLRADEADLRYTDPVVDAWFADLSNSCVWTVVK